MPNTNPTDITSSLHNVTGGAGAGKAIVSGAKAAWNMAKPWLGRADKAVDVASKYGGGALAAKEGYDLLTGGNDKGGSTPAVPQSE